MNTSAILGVAFAAIAAYQFWYGSPTAAIIFAVVSVGAFIMATVENGFEKMEKRIETVTAAIMEKLTRR